MNGSLFDFLLGEWRVEREIEDRLGDQDGAFVGSAEFSGTAPELTYRECGTLTLAVATVRAERTYLWRCTHQGAEVFHANGDLFHSFTLADPSAHHICGADTYEGAYRFESDTHWHLTWRVSGPRKDYTSTTTYLRAL